MVDVTMDNTILVSISNVISAFKYWDNDQIKLSYAFATYSLTEIVQSNCSTAKFLSFNDMQT